MVPTCLLKAPGFNDPSMDIIYLLLPLSLVLVVVIVWAIVWAVRSKQFDDLEGPAHRVLMDEDNDGSGAG